MTVADLMTASPRFVGPKTSVADALALLDEHDIRHLPVIEESGLLLSIVSDRDLRPLADPDVVDDPALMERLLARPVSAVLKRLAVAVRPETPLAEAASVMVDERIGAVPVVADDTGALVGILSYVDLLRHAFGA